MNAELVAAGFARLHANIQAITDPVERAREANDAATVLRQFEAELCNTRDTALREDREANPGHTVPWLVETTGIGFATITNARRKARPVRHVGRYLRGQP